MAWDDPVVWILIAAVVVFLFGASKIPQFARSIGLARKEFNDAIRVSDTTSTTTANRSTSVDASSSAQIIEPSDPLAIAAQREGIVTMGKTKEQIASELSWKLNKN